MSLAARIDSFQQRHPASGIPLGVLYKFVDDQGSYLAALIAYYGFISLFPLMLIFTTVLSVVLRNDPEMQQRIVDSAMSQIPVVGDQLGEPATLSGGGVGIAVGIAGAIYGGLGVSVAFQHAMNVIWAVPRADRPNMVRARIRGMAMLATIGTAIVALTAVNGFASTVELGVLSRALTIIGSIAVTSSVLVVAFRIGTARPLGVRDVLPGAIAAAIGWQILQTFGSVYVRHVIANASASNGVFATVLGLLAFLYVSGAMVVMCLELNAVRVDRLYPRSLLAAVIDSAPLTSADKAVYAGLAQAQRNKGFERIDVSFEAPDLHASDVTDPLQSDLAVSSAHPDADADNTRSTGLPRSS